MFIKTKMNKSLFAASVVSAVLSASAQATVTDFSHDFEGLPVADGGTALSDLGWQVAGQVFDGSAPYPGIFSYFYGLFPAPNHDFGFSSVATGDATNGGIGTNYLNMYSDYNNLDHGTSPNVINSLFLQEFSITADDIGKTVTFTFDAKRPDFQDDGLGGDNSPAVGNNCTLPCSAQAFLKTLDPGAGFAQTNIDSEDMTAISQGSWTTYTLTLDLTDPLLVGQLLQVGFENSASLYENSGVYYDNVSLSVSGSQAEFSTPIPAFAIAAFAALLGFAGINATRKRLK